MALRQGSSRKKGLDVASCLASLRNSRKTSVAGARRDLTATGRGWPARQSGTGVWTLALTLSQLGSYGGF